MRLLGLLFMCLLASVTHAQDCVILLHGIARSESSLSNLQTSLEKAGYQAKSFPYPDRTKDILGITQDLVQPITTYASQCPGKVNFVTHSMGGLVARAYLHQNKLANLGRVVMLAPPNQGSEVADFLQTNTAYKSFFGPAGQELITNPTVSLTTLLGVPDYPVGVIAGTRSSNPPTSLFILPGADDGAVTVSRTRLPNQTDPQNDFLTLPVTHTFMMNNATVQSQTLTFLKTGHFNH